MLTMFGEPESELGYIKLVSNYAILMLVNLKDNSKRAIINLSKDDIKFLISELQIVLEKINNNEAK